MNQFKNCCATASPIVADERESVDIAENTVNAVMSCDYATSISQLNMSRLLSNQLSLMLGNFSEPRTIVSLCPKNPTLAFVDAVIMIDQAQQKKTKT